MARSGFAWHAQIRRPPIGPDTTARNSGVFFRKIPLGLLAGYVYAYAGDSPTNFTDPFSLQTTVTGPVTSPYPGTPSPTEVQEAVEAVEAALAGGGAAAAAATAGLVVVDAGLAYYDYNQFRKLCTASGWSWCSNLPSPQPGGGSGAAPQPMPGMAGRNCGTGSSAGEC